MHSQALVLGTLDREEQEYRPDRSAADEEERNRRSDPVVGDARAGEWGECEHEGHRGKPADEPPPDVLVHLWGARIEFRTNP